MIAITRIRLLRLLMRVLGSPLRITAMLDEQIKRAMCIASGTARLFPESCIINSLNRPACVQIGTNALIRGDLTVLPPAGTIKIGSYCYVGDHTRIWSAIGVTIGDRVLISHCVNIHDHNAHPTAAAQRHFQAVEIFSGCSTSMTGVAMAPIVIEDDVWIGFGATIMKGVTIGKGAIIAAASMITKDVAPYAIMAGNPARQVGTASG